MHPHEAQAMRNELTEGELAIAADSAHLTDEELAGDCPNPACVGGFVTLFDYDGPGLHEEDNCYDCESRGLERYRRTLTKGKQ